MAKEFLFNTLLPTAGLISTIYFIFGSDKDIRKVMVHGWIVTIIMLTVAAMFNLL